jgi:hypothetical protein
MSVDARIVAPVRLAVILGALACASTLTPAGASLDANWPQSMIGEWNVDFRLDSLRSREGGTAHWTPASFATTRGALRLIDASTAGSGTFRSSIQINFGSLLGRPMSCFDPPPTQTAIEREGDTVRLQFTPGVADCGLSAYATIRGDSLVGTWEETSFAGPTVLGRFRMTRPER